MHRESLHPHTNLTFWILAKYREVTDWKWEGVDNRRAEKNHLLEVREASPKYKISFKNEKARQEFWEIHQRRSWRLKEEITESHPQGPVGILPEKTKVGHTHKLRQIRSHSAILVTKNLSAWLVCSHFPLERRDLWYFQKLIAWPWNKVISLESF